MTLRVVGMHGLGDNIHQRAILRQLMQRDVVYLETSWPCVVHDLVGERLHLVAKRSGLRTQEKNARREAGKFVQAPSSATTLRIWYPPESVRRHGSVLGAMLAEAGCDIATADFRLPIPPEWQARVTRLFELWRQTKPIMLYRPLIERKEWSGCAARNPDHASYAALYRSIRERFFVVSVADLEPGKEWLVGEPHDADVRLHAGELEFEALAALVQASALVFSSPGFAIPLAQAVGTPSVCVFGGYENGQSFSAGAKFAPHLPLEPINPCQCFQHHHACDKRMNLPLALERLQAFVA